MTRFHATLILALASLFLLSMRADAEDPPEATTLPEPPLVVAPPNPLALHPLVLYDFAKTDAKVDDWLASENVALSRANGALRAKCDGNDPHLVSPEITDAFPNGAGLFLVKLRARRTNSGFAQIFFSERDRPDFDELHAPRFALPEDVAIDRARTVDVELLVETQSPVKRLRFDPGLNSGICELERLEIVRVLTNPIRFGAFRVENGRLSLAILLDGPRREVEIEAKFVGDRDARASSIVVDGAANFEIEFPKRAPFETLELVAKTRDAPPVRRRFRSFNRDVLERILRSPDVGARRVLKSGALRILFEQDASGAVVLREDRPIAVLFPLLDDESGDARRKPLSPRFLEERGFASEQTPRAFLRFREQTDDRAVEFDVLQMENDAEKNVGTLKFAIEGDSIDCELDAHILARAPNFALLGKTTAAALPGVEFLERGERSSSARDVAPNERARFAPDPICVAAPYAVLQSDAAAVAFVYRDPNAQIYFAVPDFLEGDENAARVDLAAKRARATIIVMPPQNVEETILRAIKTLGLPDPPKRPRSDAAQDDLYRRALLGNALKTPSGAFASAVADGLPCDGEHYGTDFLSAIWELTGKIPETPRLDVGATNLPNYSSLLVLKRADLLAAWMRDVKRAALQRQGADGAFRYDGKYARGTNLDSSSGVCGANLCALAEVWRLTADREALDALIRGLRFANRFALPRGAQTWELSLAAPDLLAAAQMTRANVLAFRATDDPEYLQNARRWAILGMPFLYLRQTKELDAFEDPVALYATIPAYATTDWIAPCWIGTPVQWCGVDFAYSLAMLAHYDDSLEWRTIAEGILASAERQVYPDGPYAGLLPDSYDLRAQQRRPLNINPCALRLARRVLDGKFANVAVADVKGKRLVAPFPIRVEDGTASIDAPDNLVFQILIDGSEIRTIQTPEDRVLVF